MKIVFIVLKLIYPPPPKQTKQKGIHIKRWMRFSPPISRQKLGLITIALTRGWGIGHSTYDFDGKVNWYTIFGEQFFGQYQIYPFLQKMGNVICRIINIWRHAQTFSKQHWQHLKCPLLRKSENYGSSIHCSTVNPLKRMRQTWIYLEKMAMIYLLLSEKRKMHKNICNVIPFWREGGTPQCVYVCIRIEKKALTGFLSG